MPNRIGTVWSFVAEAASVVAGDVYLIAGPEVQNASSTGATAPTTATNVSGGYSKPWSTPTNALADDGSVTTTNSVSAPRSDYLDLSGFGFSIPTDATNLTVTARIDRTIDTGSFLAVETYYNSGTFGPYLNNISTSGDSLFSTWAGSSFTPTMINSSTFKLRLYAGYNSGTGNVSVDFASVDVSWAGDYLSKTRLFRMLSMDTGFVGSSMGNAAESYIPVEVISGDYNISSQLPSAGAVTPIQGSSSSSPLFLKGTYASIVNPVVLRRGYINSRYPMTIDLSGVERIIGNEGLTRAAGTDVRFVGLHFPASVSANLKLVLYGEM